MYTTSTNYKNYIKEPSRMFESKITLGNRTFTNDDLIQLSLDIKQAQNGYFIGNTLSRTAELTLKNDNGTYASIGKLDIDIGLKMGQIIEYIPQGIFYFDSITKTDYTVKITAYDSMILFETAYTEKYTNPTLQQVIDQLADITGVEFDSSVTVPNYTLTKLSGYTCREILGYVASLLGGNAYITRDNKFTIRVPCEVDCEVTADNYWDYDIEDSIYKVGMITCQNQTNTDVSEDDDYDSANEKNTISVGELGTDSMELTFINPWVTESILNDIYDKIGGLEFLGYSIKWQGDLSLDTGDIITVTDKHNVSRKAVIFADKLSYTGGLTQTTSAKGQTKTENEFSTTDSTTELNRISVKVLLAEKAIINKANISDLTAVSAKVGDLQVSIGTINTALINYAKVDDLNATNANITDLTAQYSNLSNVVANKADISDLNASNANISKLQSTVADISTLVNGNLTSANIQSLTLSADKVTVQDGFIKNAMIESLAAEKISAGTLSTNKLTISSADGGLVMSNNTIQFSDSDSNVRVQIGQDTSGDFNFIVKGEDGTTVLIDSTGIHEDAIADGLIKTDMVADKAINSNKIDYESVISGLNADGSNYINASKVSMDLNNQTLDVAFNKVVNDIDTNTTSISAIQGQITTLISNTTITVDGEEKTLKDAYNGTVQTVNSISTTLGEHTSTINTLDGTVKSNSSSIASIQTDLSGIKTSVSTVQSDLSSTKSQLSSLSTTLSGFESRVETTEEKINNLKIGGRNLLISKTKTNDVYINADDGEIKKSGVGLSTSDYISITNTTYIFTGMSGFDNRFIFYDENKNFISGILKNTTKFTFIPPGNAKFLRVSCKYFGTTNAKLEIGNISTDWTPAPEDLEAYTDSQISTAKSEIKQTTDSISSSITNINSSITTINTTLGNKAEKSTVESISSSITSLQSSVSGITGRVSTLETNTTTLQNDITAVQDTVTSNTTEISALKNSISLKVDSSTLTSYKEEVNGKITSINSSISSMQSSINLQLDSITSSVSVLDGNNLLLNSSFEKGYSGWSARNTNNISTLSIDTANSYNGLTSLKVTTSKAGVFSNYSAYEHSISLKQLLDVGTKYVLTFYAKADSNCNFYARAGSGTYGNSISIGTNWEQHSIIFTTNSSNKGDYVWWFIDAATSIYIVSPILTGNATGTLITQSPTEVMTAFNGISDYFQVSADGAKFGNISTGDYTSMNDKGLIHHIGDTGYEYFYIAYYMTVEATVPDNSSNSWETFTYSYDRKLLTLLNGRKPKSIIVTSISSGHFYTPSGYSLVSQDWRAWCNSIGDTTFSLDVSFENTSIKHSNKIDTSGDSTYLYLERSNANGGNGTIKLLILA